MARPSKGKRRTLKCAVPADMHTQLLLESAERGLAITDLATVLTARFLGHDVRLPPRTHQPSEDVLFRAAQDANRTGPKDLLTRIPVDLLAELEEYHLRQVRDPRAESYTFSASSAIRAILEAHLGRPPYQNKPIAAPSYQQELAMA